MSPGAVILLAYGVCWIIGCIGLLYCYIEGRRQDFVSGPRDFLKLIWMLITNKA